MVVCERLDLSSILGRELALSKGMMLIVTGPGSMADDVRNTIPGLERNNTSSRLWTKFYVVSRH